MSGPGRGSVARHGFVTAVVVLGWGCKVFAVGLKPSGKSRSTHQLVTEGATNKMNVPQRLTDAHLAFLRPPIDSAASLAPVWPSASRLGGVQASAP